MAVNIMSTAENCEMVFKKDDNVVATAMHSGTRAVDEILLVHLENDLKRIKCTGGNTPHEKWEKLKAVTPSDNTHQIELIKNKVDAATQGHKSLFDYATTYYTLIMELANLGFPNAEVAGEVDAFHVCTRSKFILGISDTSTQDTLSRHWKGNNWFWPEILADIQKMQKKDELV
jgi:hypothetical protein